MEIILKLSILPLLIWSTDNYGNFFFIPQILTDRHLRVLGDPSGNSYAIGDCADIKDYSLPCTAQVGFQGVRGFQIKLLF